MEPSRENPKPPQKEIPVEKPKSPEVERKPDFEALVVLGKNWRGDTADLPAFRALSIESRIGAMAAGILYEQGSVGKIIFSGGTTREGLPSEAEAMAQYLKKRFPNIPDEAVLLEKESKYTRDNVEKTAKILEDNGIKEAAQLTFGYHTGRAESHATRFGFDVEQVFSSEEIAKEQSGHARALLERLREVFYDHLTKRLK